jgi:putative DNA methylase
VRSPDPVAKGAMVPLISSFMLSTKEGKKTWVEPVIDPTAEDGYRFNVRTGELSKTDEEQQKKGTKSARGSNFVCILTGAAINGDHVKAEGVAGRLGVRLIAMVAEGKRTRFYLPPTDEQESLARTAEPAWEPEGDLPNDPRNFWTVSYGLNTFASLFTTRQLVALTTFSGLVVEARERVLADSRATDISDDATHLHEGGSGATAYADAVATYLAFGVSRLADAQNALCQWGPSADQTQHLFRRHAIPMIWDFAESSIFSGAAGDYKTSIHSLCKALEQAPASGIGDIRNINASKNSFPVRPIIISTDPPYYDNIGYADLSDFFYVWLKRTLADIWPDLFRRLSTPKSEELVATPYRHGGKDLAESFFMKGMGDALVAMRTAATDGEPLAIYYAFKQSEMADDGITSAGWASFLQAVVDAGLAVDGTWPVRTERSARSISIGTNALASSIVLVCRKRGDTAKVITRAEFLRSLKREMPDAVDKIRKAGVGPVDMPQSVIGPGMGVFSRYFGVLEDDDSPMSVKTALALINRIWGEIENDLENNFDAETQVALAWFVTYGFDARASGDLITLANAKNIPLESLFRSGIFENFHGKAGLIPREKLESGWSPAKDKTPTVWECVQHTARVLRAANGGAEAAAKLLAAMGPKAEDARALAYRLYEIASQKGWAAEALVYNELAQEWTHLEDVAGKFGVTGKQSTPMLDLFGETVG